MKKRETLFELFEKTYRKSPKSSFSNITSINDLREFDEHKGKFLNNKQRLALNNYENYRIAELNSAKNEEEFHQKYELLQVMANLRPYQDFLKDINKD